MQPLSYKYTCTRQYTFKVGFSFMKCMTYKGTYNCIVVTALILHSILKVYHLNLFINLKVEHAFLISQQSSTNIPQYFRILSFTIFQYSPI